MKGRPTKEQFQVQLEVMVSTLRKEILEGKYAPGDYLPSEKTLVTSFNLSNNSIRKGLDLLVEEGWIEKIPRVGNRIAEGHPPVKLVLACNDLVLRNLQLAILLDDFRRLYPWITVEIKGGSRGDAENKDQDASDIIMMDKTVFERLAEDGLADMFEILPDNMQIYPSLANVFSVEGQLYMYPLIFSPIVLCYNKAHFRECGLPEPDGSWTWDDLVRNAEKLTNGKGRYGFCFHVQNSNRWPLFLLQSGERFEWDQEGLRDIRGSKLLESMKLLKSILHNRQVFPFYLSDSNDYFYEMFLEGKISMTLNSYMGFNVWKQTNLEYDVSPVPFIHEPRTLLLCLGVGVSSRSLYKEEAMLLVDYLLSPRAQNLIRKHTLSIPSLGSLSTKVEENESFRPDRYPMYREVMSSFRTHQDLNISTQAFPKLFKELKDYLANMIDEDELCDRIGCALTEKG